MTLRSINIENFRCFQQFSLSFTPGVNVVIGCNGAGKTSLVQAMVYALSFPFTNDKSMGEHFLAAGNPDLKISAPGPEEAYRDPNTHEAATHMSISGKIDCDGQEIAWEMYKKTLAGSNVYPSRYADAYRRLVSLMSKGGSYPVLAYYSDGFPHRHTSVSKFATNEIDKADGTLRNFGYYQWDKETACTTIWQRRILNTLLRATPQDGDPIVKQELDFVLGRLTAFSRAINDNSDKSFEIKGVLFSLNKNNKGTDIPTLHLTLKSGVHLPFYQLPAGYLRLYSIVLDLACRAWLLNRTPNAKPTGLAIIDEMELHLHPSLQQEVVERFTRTFPQMQFVMTTHSPLIISRLPQADGRNQILRLEAGEKQPYVMADLYGIDYNTSLCMMDVQPTNEDLEFLKDIMVRCMRRGDTQMLEYKMQELRKWVSEQRFNDIISEIQERADAVH